MLSKEIKKIARRILSRTNIAEIPFSELKTIKDFGMVVLGAGGDVQEWIDGISKELIESKIVQDEEVFEKAYKVTGNIKGKGGRLDLVLIFSNKAKPNIGKLALWRLRFGDVSWLDDFIVNYKKDYEF